MKRLAFAIISGLAATAAFVMTTGCERDAPAQNPTASGQSLTGRLVITGSSTAAPLVAEIARRFETRYPDTRIDVQTGGSSRGIRDVTSGLAELGMSSRTLFPNERANLETHVFANDGVCFIVHADNPITTLSEVQLAAIYRGDVDRWSEVGGSDEPITVISRAEGRSELSLVAKHLGIDPSELRPDAIAGENQQGIKQVASDPNAICFMSLGTSLFEAAIGTPVRLLPLGGVEATRENVASGRFPLARPLLFVHRSDAEHRALIDAFVAFAMSAGVHDLVEANAFVPSSH